MATVLVVDDDAPSREFMRTLLSYRGHRIREASDGDAALDLVGRQRPDAVITDVLMPGLDGYELARALRTEPATRHIPIVFSTAHYGPQEIQPLIDACDVHDVIFKPADPATVLATIDALLAPGRMSVRPADQLAETLRLTRSGAWELEPATNTVIVSPELRDTLRLPSTRLSLDELLRRVHPDDVSVITTMVEDAYRAGAPGTAELRLADLDGVVHELIVSCRPSGASVLWGVVQDVTGIREELRARMRVQADWHAIRRTIDSFHRAVLPDALPTVPGAALAAVYLPAPERLDIGAAWYDAVAVAGGQVLLSVGKVAGHDRQPAAVMAGVLAALHAYAHDDPDPVSVLARLNRLLTDTRRDDAFATAVVALFDPGSGSLRVAIGGHPGPLMLSHDRDGTPVAWHLGPAGPALGILPGAAFPAVESYLPPGSALCLFTDGLMDPAAHRQRLQRIAATAYSRLGDADAAAHVLADTITREMIGTAVPDDDVCVAVLYSEG